MNAITLTPATITEQEFNNLSSANKLRFTADAVEEFIAKGGKILWSIYKFSIFNTNTLCPASVVKLKLTGQTNEWYDRTVSRNVYRYGLRSAKGTRLFSERSRCVAKPEHIRTLADIVEKNPERFY